MLENEKITGIVFTLDYKEGIIVDVSKTIRHYYDVQFVKVKETMKVLKKALNEAFKGCREYKGIYLTIELIDDDFERFPFKRYIMDNFGLLEVRKFENRIFDIAETLEFKTSQELVKQLFHDYIVYDVKNAENIYKANMVNTKI